MKEEEINNKKVALVTGVRGQDGSIMTKLLLSKGYEVYGMVRRISSPNFWRLERMAVMNAEGFTLVEGDLTDGESLYRVLTEVVSLSNTKDIEIYNFAANSFVGNSWRHPVDHMNTNVLGVVRLLNAVRKVCPSAKVYLAGSSEQFGKVKETPQTENTPFHPRSPYGVSKVAQHWMGINYKESYNMFIVNAILFNHESPFRGDEFVTQKICRCMVEFFKEGKSFQLGNINSKRDWGHAEDYMEACYLMMQQSKPEVYVVASGEAKTVREFVESSADYYSKKVEWKGEGLEEQGFIDGKLFLTINEKYYRPAEVDILLGDPSKIKQELGWKPKFTFDDLVTDMMVEAEWRYSNGERITNV